MPKPLEPDWMRRPSRLARGLLVATLVLIVYASLSPWTGWRYNGVPPFAYLTSPLPRYITGFDLAVNLLGYLPLGAFAMLSLHPRVRGFAAVALATAAGVLLSGSMEALQIYLPPRVSSSLDLATNSAGAALGALLAWRFGPGLIDRSRLAQLRAQWFRRDASVALVLVALWPLAQIHPGDMLFGNGELRAQVERLFDALDWWPTVLDPDNFGAAEFILAEAMATAAGVLAAGLTLAANMSGNAPRVRLLLALVAAALCAKTLALGVEFGPDQAFGWATSGAIGGLAIGLLTLFVGSAGRPRSVARLALLATAALILIVNLSPENPYHAQWLEEWQPGRLIHAARAIEWLASTWPFALLLWLITAAFARLPRSGSRTIP